VTHTTTTANKVSNPSLLTAKLIWRSGTGSSSFLAPSFFVQIFRVGKAFHFLFPVTSKGVCSCVQPYSFFHKSKSSVLQRLKNTAVTSRVEEHCSDNSTQNKHKAAHGTNT
jgi:hypothetical protein